MNTTTTAQAAAAFNATKSQQEAVSGSLKPKFVSQIDTSGSHKGNAVVSALRNPVAKTFDEAASHKNIGVSPAFNTDAGKSRP